MYEPRYLALDDADCDGSGYEVGPIEIAAEIIHYDLDDDEDFEGDAGLTAAGDPGLALPPSPESVSAVLPPDVIPPADGDTALPAATRKTVAAKKPSANGAPGKRATQPGSPRKAARKKAPAKTPARKASAKKTAGKKAAADRPAVKKAAARKAPAKKSSGAAGRRAVPKNAVKKAQKTTVRKR